MSFIKNLLVNWYSSMKKKLRNISMIDFESLIWALFDTSPLNQFAKFNNLI